VPRRRLGGATWFKGGSEPGVPTLAYLATTTRTGQSYVVTVLAENPSQPINEAASGWRQGLLWARHNRQGKVPGRRTRKDGPDSLLRFPRPAPVREWGQTRRKNLR